MFTSYGRDQTCAMLLAVAAGNSFLDFEDQGSFGAIGTPSTELAAAAKQAFYDIGERPTWTERVTYGTSKPHSRTQASSLLTRCRRRSIWYRNIQW